MKEKRVKKELETNFENFRFGGDENKIDESPDVQNYLKLMYAQIKTKNKLLGDFSVYGTYSISKPEMRDYLIKETKFFQDRNGDEVYASRTLSNVVLNFKIVFDISSSIQSATLFITEIERRIDEDNIVHTTKLAEIHKANRKDFVNFVYHEWNVSLAPSEYMLENDYAYLHVQKYIAMFDSAMPLLNVSSELYLLSMLPHLSKLGNQGQSIKNQYNNKLKKLLGQNPKLNESALFKKALLDQIMRQQDFFPTLAEDQRAGQITKEFSDPFKVTDLGRSELQFGEGKTDMPGSSFQHNIAAGGSRQTVQTMEYRQPIGEQATTHVQTMEYRQPIGEQPTTRVQTMEYRVPVGESPVVESENMAYREPTGGSGKSEEIKEL